MTRAEIEGLCERLAKEDSCVFCEGTGRDDDGGHCEFCRGAGSEPTMLTEAATALRAMLAREEAMREALRAAHDAIASLPQDALGIGHRAITGEDDPAGQYPIRDELLTELARHLAQGDGE